MTLSYAGWKWVSMGIMGLDGIYFRCHLSPMETQHDTILPKIEAFLDRHAMGETIFGGVFRDTHLIYDLRDGRKLRRPLRRKIEDFMKSYKNGKSK